MPAIKLVRSVNFGISRGGLSTVGFELIDGDGVSSVARTTTGVSEMGTSTGIYTTQITFAANFSGSILWDTGEGAGTLYAAEEYNPTDERISFIQDIEGGKWTIDSDNNQMIFYKDDNATEVARYDLTDSDGNASSSEVFTRTRVS